MADGIGVPGRILKAIAKMEIETGGRVVKITAGFTGKKYIIGELAIGFSTPLFSSFLL